MTPHIISIAAGIVLFWLSIEQPQPAAPAAPPPAAPRGPDPWPRIPEPAADSYRDDTGREVVQ